MDTKTELLAEAKAITTRLGEIKILINFINQDINNNVFKTLEEAENVLSVRMKAQAEFDCLELYDRGLDTYTQDFIVNFVEYVATGMFTYGRNDKTFYFVDTYDFSYDLK
jgi:hypothetical protein